MSDETTPTPPLPHAAPAPAAAEAGEWIELIERAEEAERLRADWQSVATLETARAAAAEAERDRLGAELAALRGAMPDTLTLTMIASRIEHQCADDDDAAVLRRMLAALATATPTPPAAEAGTGGGRWMPADEASVTRALVFAAMAECNDEWGATPSDELIAAAAEYRAWEYEQPEPDQEA